MIRMREPIVVEAGDTPGFTPKYDDGTDGPRYEFLCAIPGVIRRAMIIEGHIVIPLIEEE